MRPHRPSKRCFSWSAAWLIRGSFASARPGSLRPSLWSLESGVPLTSHVNNIYIVNSMFESPLLFSFCTHRMHGSHKVVSVSRLRHVGSAALRIHILNRRPASSTPFWLMCAMICAAREGRVRSQVQAQNARLSHDPQSWCLGMHRRTRPQAHLAMSPRREPASSGGRHSARAQSL